MKGDDLGEFCVRFIKISQERELVLEVVVSNQKQNEKGFLFLILLNATSLGLYISSSPSEYFHLILTERAFLQEKSVMFCFTGIFDLLCLCFSLKLKAERHSSCTSDCQS